MAKDDDIIKDALEQFEESEQSSTENRASYLSDTRFARLSDQWPDKVKNQREKEGRPALTINKLPALIRSVVNESRQNRPAIKVAPVDNGADEDTAEVIGGLVKSIERNSNAEVAYNTAIDHAVTGGFGFFRIDIDYANEESFDMEAVINRIPNPLTVHWDASTTEFDASDWRYAFVSQMMDKDKFKKEYPDAAAVDFEGSTTNEDQQNQWSGDTDEVRLAEYYVRSKEQRTIVQLQMPDGAMEIVREDMLAEMATEYFGRGGMDLGSASDEDKVRAYMEAAQIQEQQRREADYFKVVRYLVNGSDVLETTPWPGSSIPICPVWGDEVYDEGRRIFRSMIRDAKDPQLMFNYWRSASTELVALAPKAPWVGPVGFVPKGHEDKWANANTRSYSHLEYEGNIPPQRQAFAGVPAGALQEAMNANDDMKAITGIFDSSLGARSNETSGKAILARERQGDVSNFHFLDNLSRAIRYAGTILVDIIPAVYSTRQTIRTLGDDSKQNVVKLTQESGEVNGENGKPKLYNLSVGKYDVTVSTGPTFATQREETRETLIEIMRQVPDAAPFIGDVLMDHMDFVGADRIAKRLSHLLPPEVRQAEEAEEGGEDPQVAQMKGEMQKFQQEAQQFKEQVMQEIQKITQENERLINKTSSRPTRSPQDRHRAMHR